MKNYALVGDIHSQFHKLESALAYCGANNLHPVFLGDIFDSRCKTSDSVSVYFTLRRLQEAGECTILRSNHQDKLERYLRGTPGHTPPELLRTVDDMEEGGVHCYNLLRWLESLPHGFCFKQGGKEWRCAHAFFPSWLKIEDYEESLEVRPTSKQARFLCMYGPSHKEGRGRVFWWESESNRKWTRVAGHYHIIHQSENSLVLDGGCGGETRSWFCDKPAVLVIYNVGEQKMEFV